MAKSWNMKNWQRVIEFREMGHLVLLILHLNFTKFMPYLPTLRNLLLA